MERYLPIRKVYAREVLDSRGNPTVEVEVTVGEGVVGRNGYTGRAIVPSATQPGSLKLWSFGTGETIPGTGRAESGEQCKRKDGRCGAGRECAESETDRPADHGSRRDGEQRTLGANATLRVSRPVADAAAKALRLPLYQYLGGCITDRMPVPMMNILNGGNHAKNTVDFQEFMILPVGTCSFKESLRMGGEMYHKLKLMSLQIREPGHRGW